MRDYCMIMESISLPSGNRNLKGQHNNSYMCCLGASKTLFKAGTIPFNSVSNTRDTMQSAGKITGSESTNK